MRRLLALPALALVLSACQCPKPAAKPAPVPDSAAVTTPADSVVEKPWRHYDAAAILGFVDSVAALPLADLQKQANHVPDSAFRQVDALDIACSAEDMDALRAALPEGQVPMEVAKRVFVGFVPDSAEAGADTLFVRGQILGKGKATSLVACPGYAQTNMAWECDCYFFSENRLRARKHLYHRYGLELAHFVAEDGAPVFYYRENFESGTGIWWWQYFFYKFQGGKLIPALQVPAELNMQPYARKRAITQQAKIGRTSPLSISMEYEVQMFDSQMQDYTFLKGKSGFGWTWDAAKQEYVPKAGSPEIARMQALQLYGADLLFVHVYANEIRAVLDGKDAGKRTAMLLLVEDVMDAVQE